MAASGYTPIQLYRSATASAAPLAANLSSGELAINYNDGTLYYKDSSGVVKVLARQSPISGSGTTNYVAKFTSSSAVGNSVIYDDGTNVGIGTATPRGLLSIANNNSVSGVVDSSLHFGFSLADYYGFRITNSNDPAVTAAGLLKFQRGTTSAWVDALAIDNSGNVGIGTSIPTVKLDIGGSTALAIQASLTTGTTDPNFHLYAVNGATGSAAGTEVARFGVGYGGNASTSFSSGFSFIRGGGATDGSLAILTSASERMRINSSGNVGIGTSSPAQKLDVVGAIKTTGGLLPRAASNANQTSPWAWSSASYDQQAITALANALTINADSGSPVDGQKTTFRIKDNGTGRALTWTTGSTNSFRAIGVTLPTTTVANKTVYVGCIYNAADSRWDVVSVAQEA